MAGLMLPQYSRGQPDYMSRSQQSLNAAGNTYARMDKKRPAPPGKSAGGALASGASMGMAGMQVGGMLAAEGGLLAGSAMAGPVGLGIGAAVGLGSYLFS